MPSHIQVHIGCGIDRMIDGSRPLLDILDMILKSVEIVLIKHALKYRDGTDNTCLKLSRWYRYRTVIWVLFLTTIATYILLNHTLRKVFTILNVIFGLKYFSKLSKAMFNLKFLCDILAMLRGCINSVSRFGRSKEASDSRRTFHSGNCRTHVD